MMVTRRLFTGPRIAGVLIALALALALWFMLRTPAVPIESAEVTRGVMTVTVDDIGETRVKDLYTVSAPVTGELLRVPLKPGAPVEQGRTLLAEIQPIQPDPLDARSRAQIVATIAQARAQAAAARSRVQEAQAAERLATAEFGRVDKLVESGFVTRARHDQARADLARSRAAVAEAGQAANAAAHALRAAEASLIGGGGSAIGPRASVTAPISGTVLRVLQESRRTVVSGTPLMELGDPERIEVVADMLSSDAVRVRPGASVAIDAWGGDKPLMGKVRLVEPYGFTKISALGVEEQRVNVVIDIIEPRLAWERLGHGYRVTVRIAVWEGRDVVQAPISALFRDRGQWTTFVVGSGGRARQRRVEIGRMNDEVAEVTRGLRPGDRVVMHPSDRLKDGSLVRSED